MCVPRKKKWSKETRFENLFGPRRMNTKSNDAFAFVYASFRERRSNVARRIRQFRFYFQVVGFWQKERHFDSSTTLSFEQQNTYTHNENFFFYHYLGRSTTGRLPIRALRATHSIHWSIGICFIRRLLCRSRVRFLSNRTREQTPTKSVGREAQRESDISSVFTSRGR